VKIAFSPQAEHDLAAATSYRALHSERSAEQLRARLIRALEFLASGRVSGPPVRHPRYGWVRGWLVPPYRIYYREDRDADVLQVLRVYHHARRPLSG
jgi:plasmid stabilization system protein ParE